jgi:hypothetical protein
VQKEELEKLRKELEANLKMSSRAARGNTGRANLPRELKSAKNSGPCLDLAGVTSNIVQAAEAAAGDVQEDDCDNPELPEDVVNQDSRMEPTEWEGLPESVSAAIQVDAGSIEPLTEDREVREKIETRKEWIRMWVAKVCRHVSVNSEVPNRLAEQCGGQGSRDSKEPSVRHVCS